MCGEGDVCGEGGVYMVCTSREIRPVIARAGTHPTGMHSCLINF